jgi:galactokinase/mevalonate kinase-like predicted kinase
MPAKKHTAKRVINCVAPIRICDLGGWTDTWFAKHGRIFNIGVYPYAEAQIEVFPYEGQEDRIVIHAENFGERYVVRPERLRWDRHPLLEAAIEYMRVPKDLAFQVTIFSEAPSGGSTGTSAAVTVALIGALDSLTPGRMTAHEVAGVAQRIETELLKQQCGIQDQLCSAYGGINYIEMFDYPHASVSPVTIPNSVWWELERRLVLVYLGKSHSSSQVHEMVIHELEDAGPDCRKLQDLRSTAPRGARRAVRRRLRGVRPRHDRQHRGPAPPASRAHQRRRAARARRRPRARRLGLEGERRRRRGRLGHDPVRPALPRQARHDPRARGGEPPVQEHPALPEPPRPARVGAPRHHLI